MLNNYLVRYTMRFRLYREHGAMNSLAVFDAFEQGLLALGHEVVQSNSDVDVIWSVLWHGRMERNAVIYEAARNINKPVVILEVGTLIRGTTWKVSLNHINALGVYNHETDLDESRPSKLGLSLKDNRTRKPEILLALQHQDSLQWQHKKSTVDWIEDTISEIRQYTDRTVIVRPHPRSLVFVKIRKDVHMELPKRVVHTYDCYDIDYDYHCVVNYNSGPSMQAAIHGTPVVCDSTSLAYPVSSLISTIDNPVLPDREDWFLKLTHTEWTLDEIATGLPLKRLRL